MIKAIFTYEDKSTQSKEAPDDGYRFYGVSVNGKRPIKVEVWGKISPEMFRGLQCHLHPIKHEIVINYQYIKEGK